MSVLNVTGAWLRNGATVASLNINPEIRVPRNTRRIIYEKVRRDRASSDFGKDQSTRRETASAVYTNARQVLDLPEGAEEITLKILEGGTPNAIRERSADEYMDMLADKFGKPVEEAYARGILERDSGNLAQAKILLWQAAQHEFRRDTPDPRILSESGRLHLSLGSFETAVRILTHCIQASSHPDYYSASIFIEAHTNLAAAKLAAGESYDAYLLLREALERCERSEFSETYIICSIMLLIAQTMLQSGEIEAAKKMVQSARAKRERFAGEDFNYSQLLSDEAFILGQIAMGPERTANLDITEIYEQHKQALSFREKHCAKGAPSTSESHTNLAVLLGEATEYDLALEHIKEAESVALSVAFNEEHPIFIFIHYCHAALCFRTGRIQEARFHIELALSISRVFLPANALVRVQVERLFRDIIGRAML